MDIVRTNRLLESIKSLLAESAMPRAGDVVHDKYDPNRKGVVKSVAKGFVYINWGGTRNDAIPTSEVGQARGMVLKGVVGGKQVWDT